MSRKQFMAALGVGSLALNSLEGTTTAPVGTASSPLPAGSAPLEPLLNLDDVEAQARAIMLPSVYDFVSGAAADELTVRWNREKYRDIRLQARVLRDLSGLDCSTTLLGQRMAAPILLAPTSGHRLSHPEGELATARGAGAFGATMVLSSGSNTSIEDVMSVATHPVWFQLYVLKDRGLTRALVERVQAAGVKALCVTVDSPLDGARNRQQRAHVQLPPGVTYPHYAGLRDAISIQTLDVVKPFNLMWSDIEWLRSFIKVPMLLKGVMNPADAATGLKAGADGIIVSNHGGRCLDTQPATIEALPRVVAAVNGRVPVIVDGGIRRGTDIVKALALGAAAVQIGRPYVYGLAAGGAPGVTHVLKILRQELLMAMSLLGCPTLASIDRTILWK
ncbi:alpha-hydroxy acid oxidase [Opitutus sp. GAS368]|uniref:alpha-hydroxy acid oxidase n=1 Tax=Opitutus sp. GAS368 TaxID=1882749 RepID=UPI00087B4433|nr:alpha-hydroxy acid oxidase [Opitutus sp. GAS368]SDS47607.1 4-hydroxymandelate oxidase [Opitutus sp. GAS368]